MVSSTEIRQIHTHTTQTEGLIGNPPPPTSHPPYTHTHAHTKSAHCFPLLWQSKRIRVSQRNILSTSVWKGVGSGFNPDSILTRPRALSSCQAAEHKRWIPGRNVETQHVGSLCFWPNLSNIHGQLKHVSSTVPTEIWNKNTILSFYLRLQINAQKML